MYFYTIDDKDLYAKLRYFDGISWRQNSSFLMYKQQKQETIAEADGHYIMYVVDNDIEFEKICSNKSITFKKIPVDENEYIEHFEIFRKGKQKLNEDLIHSFDELELFVNLIAVKNKTLQITDSYSKEFTDNQIKKLSKWLKNNNMNTIEFIVPVNCMNNMSHVVALFNSCGVNVQFKNIHIHGRYWIVENNGFLVDASINTTGACVAQLLYDKEVQDIKTEYLI